MVHVHTLKTGFLYADTSDTVEAICECGREMSYGHTRCAVCHGKLVAARQEAQWKAENLPRRERMHEYYRRMMRDHGWTAEDVARHAREQRSRRGDPPRPRFKSRTSISD